VITTINGKPSRFFFLTFFYLFIVLATTITSTTSTTTTTSCRQPPTASTDPKATQRVEMAMAATAVGATAAAA
jgi:hypothetical protein